MRKHNRRMKRLVLFKTKFNLDPLVQIGNMSIKYSEIQHIRDLNKSSDGIHGVALVTRHGIYRVKGTTIDESIREINKQLAAHGLSKIGNWTQMDVDDLVDKINEKLMEAM